MYQINITMHCSLQISIHSHLSCASDLVFTCGLIREFSLAAIDMQSSSLAIVGDDITAARDSALPLQNAMPFVIGIINRLYTNTQTIVQL